MGIQDIIDTWTVEGDEVDPSDNQSQLLEYEYRSASIGIVYLEEQEQKYNVDQIDGQIVDIDLEVDDDRMDCQQFKAILVAKIIIAVQVIRI